MLKSDFIKQKLKEDWIDSIEKVDDINLLENLSKSYINILKELNNIQEISERLNDNELDVSKEDSIDSNSTDEISINSYIFQRRLRGGIGIQKLNKEEAIELIPESVVREQELETGDIVKIEKHIDGINKHRFTKQKHMPKADISEEYPITSYDNAIVYYDDIIKKYTVKSYCDENGIKTIPQIIIHDNDVERYGLKDGDIVDVAHSPSRSIARVRWLYNSNQSHYVKPQKSSFYKDKTSNTKKEYNSPIEDKTILVLGADSYINSYREEIEKRKGTLLNTNSNRSTNIQHMIDNSDIVVIPIFETSHTKMEQAKAYCKKENKRFIILDNSGRSIFIKELEDNLKIA